MVIGAELVRDYLAPLAATPALRERVVHGTRVTAVARDGVLDLTVDRIVNPTGFRPDLDIFRGPVVARARRCGA